MSPRRKAKRKQAELVAAKKISRDDIESKLRELQGEVDTNLESARTVGLAAGVGIAVVLVLVAYILGRRKGRKRQMVLEIKRV